MKFLEVHRTERSTDEYLNFSIPSFPKNGDKSPSSHYISSLKTYPKRLIRIIIEE